MSKDDRRLWFGDWRDDEPTDTVVITPDDGDDPPPNVDRSKTWRQLAIVGSIAALCAIGVILASSGNDEWITSKLPLTQTQPAPTPQSQTPQAPPQAPPGGGQGFGGADLTGSDAIKAAQAALQKFPGDIERVTHDPTGGGFVVHVIQADGNEVHVLVDPAFRVQGSDADQPPRTFGPGSSQ
jgi:hypothetical protein